MSQDLPRCRLYARHWRRRVWSSSTRTVVDQAFAFASRRGKNGKDRPRFFCETNPIFSLAKQRRIPQVNDWHL